MERIKGIIPPMVTPLKNESELDLEGCRKLIEHIIGGRAGGLFILGTTGESQSLSHKLRHELVELVCKQVAGRIPVLVGISDTAIEESLALAEKAYECGASGVVAAAPYYLAPSQQEMVEYFSELADKLSLPLYLYNMPSCVKVFLEIETVLRLSEHPNIVGLKDSSANMTYFQKLLYLLRNKDFALYMGPEEMTAAAVMAGADGGINGGANLCPELYTAMYDAAVAQDCEKVTMLQERIIQISTELYSIGKYGSSYLKGLKCALAELGLCCGHIAWPYREFVGPEKVKVRQALLKTGIIK